MVEGFEVIEFPQLRHDFSDTKIYLRPTAKTQPSEVNTSQGEVAAAKEVEAESTMTESTQTETSQAEAIQTQTTDSESTEAKTAELKSIPENTTQTEIVKAENILTGPASIPVAENAQENTPAAEVKTEETQTSLPNTGTS